METININGEEYVKAGDAQALPDWDSMKHVCVIADRGWIFEGYVDPSEGPFGEHGLRLARAHVVRRWDNGLGIGGLAKAEHKDGYVLDDLGCVEVMPRAVLAVIPLEW